MILTTALNIRMSDELYVKVKRKAVKNEQTMGATIRRLIIDGLKANETRGRKANKRLPRQ